MGQFFAWVAVAAGLVSAWPQVARIVVRKDDTGVSLLALRLMVCSGVTWVAIGIVNHLVPTIVFNSLGLVGGISILTVIARLHDRSLVSIFAVVVGAASVCTAIHIVFGDVGVEVEGSALGMLMVLPQIWKAVTMRDIPGVSPIAWSLTLTSNFSWAVFGFTVNEWELIYPNILMIAGSAFVFYRSYRSNKQLKRSGVELAPIVASSEA